MSLVEKAIRKQSSRLLTQNLFILAQIIWRSQCFDFDTICNASTEL